MKQLPNGVRFNEEHYSNVVRARAKEGLRSKRYCFALNMHLGENGRVVSHELYGKKFLRNGEVYTVNSVNVHFWKGGYYWFVVFQDEKGSSAPRFFKNINSTCPIILNGIKETQEDFILIST